MSGYLKCWGSPWNLGKRTRAPASERHCASAVPAAPPSTATDCGTPLGATTNSSCAVPGMGKRLMQASKSARAAPTAVLMAEASSPSLTPAGAAVGAAPLAPAAQPGLSASLGAAPCDGGCE